jgi:hypothetical protein
MKETFIKNIDSQMADFDKSIATIKESRSINEGKIQDAMIGGRILFGLLKDEYNRHKLKMYEPIINKEQMIDYMRTRRYHIGNF